MTPTPEALRREALVELASNAVTRLETELPNVTPAIRAGAMLVANHVLRMAARTWNPSVVNDPQKAPPRDVILAMRALGELQEKTREAVEWSGKNAASMRQRIAVDVCLVSVGHGLRPDLFPGVVRIWRLLWDSRAHLTEALASMRDWEIRNGVPSLPPGDSGEYPEDEDALTCGRRFPAFLRPGARR